MSEAFVVRYQMRPETADQNQLLIENVFTELAAACPQGLRYAAFRLADGVTFVHIGVSEPGGASLPDFASFQEFQREFGTRAAGQPAAGGATVIGSYGVDFS